MNIYNILEFYKRFFRKKIQVVHDTPEGMRQGVLTRVSAIEVKASLNVSHIVNSGNSPKETTIGNPENVYLLVPGGLEVATYCRDKDGKKYYHVFTIPQMKVTGKDKEGKPIFERVINK